MEKQIYASEVLPHSCENFKLNFCFVKAQFDLVIQAASNMRIV